MLVKEAILRPRAIRIALFAQPRQGIQVHAPIQVRKPDGEPMGLTTAAVWLGLASGFLELGAIAAERWRDGQVTMETIQINHHYVWMIFVFDAALFLLMAMTASALARFRPKAISPRTWRRVWLWGMTTLAILGPALAIRGLHEWGALALSAGLAVRLTTWAVRREGAVQRAAVRSGLVLAAIAAIVGGIWGFQVASRESRTLQTLPSPPSPSSSPNVLLIVMDNVRADHLGLYGHRRDVSPNLDRWAARGVRFEDVRAPAPWTLPSHACMMTGRWPQELSTSAVHPLDSSFPTLAEVLGERGYACAGFVANTYYCNSWYGLDRGFARYEDFYGNTRITPGEIAQSVALGRRLIQWAGLDWEAPGVRGSRKTAAMINRDVAAWLDSQKREEGPARPFFAFLNYYDAHSPFRPPADWRPRFDASAADPVRREQVLSAFARVGKRKTERDGQDAASRGELIREATAILQDSYDDCIAYLDDQIGRLLDQLEERGILRDTIVIITSDHGEHFGDHGLYGHGNSLYRALIDVPLLIIPPTRTKVSTPLTVAKTASLRDLPATIADMIGASADSPFPGRSLARYWGDGSKAGDDDADTDDAPFSHVEHQKKFPPTPRNPASLGPLWAVSRDRSVYIRHSNGREELYDHLQDPGEQVNLQGAADRQEDLKRLRAEMDRVLREGGGGSDLDVRPD